MYSKFRESFVSHKSETGQKPVRNIENQGLTLGLGYLYYSLKYTKKKGVHVYGASFFLSYHFHSKENFSSQGRIPPIF